jgi:hypothetical protein
VPLACKPANNQPLEWMCRRLSGSGIDHNSFGHNNDSSIGSLTIFNILLFRPGEFS